MDINKNWFVLHVIKGKEKSVLNRLSLLQLEDIIPFLPKKKMKIRQKGSLHDKQIPLYPGYLFVIGELRQIFIKKITSVNGVIKFVGQKNNPSTINLEEKRLILSITTGKGIAEYSKVIKEGTKIKIISGPLKELEGKILSVDRRKQRAVVGLPLLNSIVNTTLSFEYIKESK